MAPRDDLRRLPWTSVPLLEVEEGIAEATDATSLTGAFAGIAETGTVMMASRPDAPTTLNFLPENHRSEEHTSELQSLMRISYAVFRLKTHSCQRATQYLLQCC